MHSIFAFFRLFVWAGSVRYQVRPTFCGGSKEVGGSATKDFRLSSLEFPDFKDFQG